MTPRPGPDPSVEDVDILKTMLMAYPPALGTSDIADRIGLSQQATGRHLNRLEEEGYVESDKVGRARIWWLTDEGKEMVDQTGSIQ